MNRNLLLAALAHAVRAAEQSAPKPKPAPTAETGPRHEDNRNRAAYYRITGRTPPGYVG